MKYSEDFINAQNTNQVSNFAQKERIVLASESPRRRELLGRLGLKFDVMPAGIDEDVGIEEPVKLVKELSKRKARAADAEDACKIGADTVVTLDGRIYGKPHCEERAKSMLHELSGKWHTVYTGVTVIFRGREYTFAARSKVLFKRLSAQDIDKYVARVRPFDKAGAYGIQDNEVVSKYRGSYSNIVGLPLEKLVKVLKRAGVINGNG